MNSIKETKFLAKVAILIAIEIIFQIIGNFIAIGPVSINLSLIPIIFAAMYLGPIGGLILGLVNGTLVILAPSTLAIFMPINPLATIALCLLKTGLAGLIAGFVFKLFNKGNIRLIGAILAGIIVPVINTSLFGAGCFLFYYSWLVSLGGLDVAAAWNILIFTVIGINFIFEITSSTVIPPILVKIKKFFN